ncbi:hypothetical protein KIN20_001126 [Parelaphostrongylus tenuis]|uniref:Uncharacterized protein n=1 Tax=Parelaphostrongylus tenuis TaxID=148309 RepID=A0AAD5QCE4_PARTN|nr:hypothetical protein KIN20_001126 [Parelaphostrongylus tenuis]
MVFGQFADRWAGQQAMLRNFRWSQLPTSLLEADDVLMFIAITRSPRMTSATTPDQFWQRDCHR